MTNTEIVLAGTVQILVNVWPVVAACIVMAIWEVKKNESV